MHPVGGGALRVALCVPTIRPDSFRAFLSAWEAVRFWDDGLLIVVEDNPTRTPELAPPDAVHVAHEDIDADLGERSWIISRRDSAIRCYGFYLAWKAGADLVVTIDDDCLPIPGRDFLAEHLAAMESQPRWVSSVDNIRPRGLPYGDLGRLDGVAANVGLWRGVPDIDAAHALVEGTPTDYEPPEGRWIVPRGQYVPTSGMNLAFRREAAPLWYFALMGEGWPYARLDDILAGILAKKAMDHLGWSLSVGRPHVEHRRASDPYRNIVKEAPGYGFLDRAWPAIDAVPLAAPTAPACMAELGAGLARHGDAYLSRLGEAITIWAGLFDA